MERITRKKLRPFFVRIRLTKTILQKVFITSNCSTMPLNAARAKEINWMVAGVKEVSVTEVGVLEAQNPP
jgi:hypothetical protein